MGQTQCHYIYPDNFNSWNTGSSNFGKNSTTSQRSLQYICEFRQFGWLKEASREEKYTIFYGIAALLFILPLWFLAFKIRHKDFSRTYVISTLAPLTIFAIFITIDKIKEWQNVLGYYTVKTLTGVAWYTLDINYTLSTTAFLILNLYTARKRVAVKNDCLVFGIILIVSILYGILCGIFSGLTRIAKGFSSLFHLTMGIFWLVLLCSLCCCTVPNFDPSSPPSIVNARSRLGWSLLFVFVSEFLFSLGWVNYGVLYDIMDGVYMSIIMIVIEMIPILYCACVVLFLPAFRSTLFCSQGSERVTDIEAVTPVNAQNESPKIQAPPPVALNLQDFGVRDGFYGQVATPMTMLPGQPVPSHMDQQNYGYQHGMNVYQHGQPAPVSVPMAPRVTAKPMYMFPSNALPVDQYHVIQQPTILTQQQPVILSQQHMVTSPVSHQVSNLVGFASQPNLATMTNSQSPFYIQG